MMFAIGCYFAVSLLCGYLLYVAVAGVADELTKLKREHALHRKIRNGTATQADYERCDVDDHLKRARDAAEADVAKAKESINGKR